MVDQATPNLPSRDFDATIAFFGPLGFELAYRDEHWMILERGSATLEFFPYLDLDPATSSFGSCLRLDDADLFYLTCVAAGIAETSSGLPRLHPLKTEPWGGRVGALIDPDGSLLRIISNDYD
jgi:catechol 2,3-dioxygenase-like lactoylglutathione lyase family enzyme